jgi:hypothetical protein
MAVQRANLLPVIATVAALTTSGCYPAWLTSRPKAKIFVTDESGAPLPGTTVTLGTMEWRGIVGRNTLSTFLTDKDGKVRFGRKHDWVAQVLLPDGDTHYSWSLCFSRPGFEAVPQPVEDKHAGKLVARCFRFVRAVIVTSHPRVVPRLPRAARVKIAET